MNRATLDLDPPYAGVTIGYSDWGNQDATQTVVCVHGLTRNSHDFDFIAAALAELGARVIAIDVVGRGASSWLVDPTGYIIPNYAGHILQLIDRLKLGEVDWIGTSMGGLIGMLVAAGEHSPIRRLVLNDIGPFITQAALARLQTYVGLDRNFQSLQEVEAYLRQIHAGFGPLSDAQWRHLATYSTRQAEDGLRLHYDPAIRIPYEKMAGADVELWSLWERIRCPAFVLRGGDSDLLSAATAMRMSETGSKALVATLEGIGHAPALMAPDQIAIIAQWLSLKELSAA